MVGQRIRVLVIGHPDPRAAALLKVEGLDAVMADDFDVTVLTDDEELEPVLATEIPHAILTFGSIDRYRRLRTQPIEVRRRWLHYDGPGPTWGELAADALRVFVDVATNDRFPDEPLVSVFTPTYRTGPRLDRAYESLCAQTWTNWEWVVYDDSPDDETWERLRRIAATDFRVRVFRSDRSCGRIGEVKRRCCGLTRGAILVELDHDDELLPGCVADVIEAFRAFPEAGFAYSDCAEVFESGTNASYGDTYAFGFGSYRTERVAGREYLVTNYPGINAKTIRHIVGVPNHVRAWRRGAYLAAGGHSGEIHVADDYELLIRTFLVTRFVHIRRFGYLQYLGDAQENTQRQRNREIQRAVALFAERYEDEIHARLLELGVPDFIRTEHGLDWSCEPPAGPVDAELQWPDMG